MGSVNQTKDCVGWVAGQASFFFKVTDEEIV